MFDRSNFTTLDTRAQFTIDTTNGNCLVQRNPAFGNAIAVYPKRRLQLALRLGF